MTADLLAPLDLAFWNLETAEHPMHLGALGVFSAHSPTAGAHAADLLAARAASVPGLRMRIRDTWHPLAFGAAVREPAPGFDPLHHVVLHAPTPDFQTEAGHLMQRPLDRTRPPWEAHVLPGEDGVTFAVLFKFHHALADGLRALTLAAAVLDPMEGPERPSRSRKQPAHEEPPTGVRRLAGLARAALPGPVRGALNATAALPGRIQGALSGTGRALDIGASVAVSGLAVRSTPALTSEPSGTRRTAGVVIDVDDVHRVRKAVGGTVNDVLIGVVAGALRRWLDERGDGSAGVVPRALVPVSQRRPRTAHPQGNRLSGYLVRLPVDQAEPLARLAAVRAAMDRNKDAGPGRGAGAVALLADHVPALGHRLGGPLAGQAARWWFDVLVTSVPLPGVALRLGGHPVVEVYPYAPLARGQALAVALSSYRGRVHVGLVADGAAVPDLDRLAAAVTAEVETLVTATAAGLEDGPGAP
ncbi:wax ester/triacylglycerol synthase family O-acyltransferase [Streptomyces acidiscabies]|uniref:wax ester/triacylglycerol synthase family O-acyltransferase n=1 Tax=Streptomyces acidiscabies TaxID=42234 RepID=UPI0009534912|nr:wax ester/triacylglycerol synthase family O-acyltransferase [Streptomyces acidiscabies]